MEPKNDAIVVAKAITDNKVEGVLVLWLGEVKITDPKEQVEALRGFIRSTVLKQFGIVSINRTLVNAAPLGFNDNNVQTRLKLPKPLTRLTGEVVENLEAYYKRVLPQIQHWLRASIKNSAVTEAAVQNML
jgi:hypothetical protein